MAKPQVVSDRNFEYMLRATAADDLFFALQNMAGDRETSVEGVVQSILRRSVNLDSEAVLSKDGGALRCDDSPALGM